MVKGGRCETAQLDNLNLLKLCSGIMPSYKVFVANANCNCAGNSEYKKISCNPTNSAINECKKGLYLSIHTWWWDG